MLPISYYVIRHFVNWTSGQLVIFTNQAFCHKSFCQLVISLSGHFVTSIWTAGHLLILSFCSLVISLLVILHNNSQIGILLQAILATGHFIKQSNRKQVILSKVILPTRHSSIGHFVLWSFQSFSHVITGPFANQLISHLVIFINQAFCQKSFQQIVIS